MTEHPTTAIIIYTRRVRCDRHGMLRNDDSTRQVRAAVVLSEAHHLVRHVRDVIAIRIHCGDAPVHTWSK